METGRRTTFALAVLLAVFAGFALMPTDVSADTSTVYGSTAEPYGGMYADYDMLEDGGTYYLVKGGHVSISFHGIDATGMETDLAGTGLSTNYITDTIEGDIQKGATVTIADKTITLEVVEGVYGDLPIYGATTTVDCGSAPDATLGLYYDETITIFDEGVQNLNNSSIASDLSEYGLTMSLSLGEVVREGISTTDYYAVDCRIYGTPSKGGDNISAVVNQKYNLYNTNALTLTITINDDYSINFDGNGGSASTSSMTVQYGSTITLPSATRADYSFQGWYTQASGGICRGTANDTYDPIAHYTVAQSPITLYAQWVEDVNPVTSISVSSYTSVEVGKSVTVTAIAYPSTADNRYVDFYIDSGDSYIDISSVRNSTGGKCTITGVSPGTASIIAQAVDGSGITKTITVTVSEEVTTYAYTLTYDDNGGSSGPESYSIESTSTSLTTSVSTVKPSRDGYKFLGWSTNASDSLQEYVGGNTIALNPGTTTLYAIWEKLTVTWTVTFEANGGTGAPDHISALVESDTTSHTFTLPSGKPTLDGYTFDGWSRSASGVGSYQPSGEFVAYEQNSVLYAIWSVEVVENTFTLIFDLGADDATGAPGTMSTTTDTTTYTAGIPNTTPLREGYSFEGWGINAGTSEARYHGGDDIVLSPGTTTLYAVWSQASFVLTLDSNGGLPANRVLTGSGTGECTITIPSDYKPERDGYVFVGWSLSPNGGNEYAPGAQFTLYESQPSDVLYAVWQKESVSVTYTLTFDANEGEGAPEPMTEDSVDGSTVAFTIPDMEPTRTGYDFLGWSNDPDAIDPVWKVGDTLEPTQVNTLVYAVWKIKMETWTLTFDANGGSGAPDMISEEETGSSHIFSIPAQIPERQDYSFIGWGERFDSTKDEIVAQPSGKYESDSSKKTLYAVWEPKPVEDFYLYFDPNGGIGQPSDMEASGTNPYRFTLPETIPELEGKRFIGWKDPADGTIYGPGEPYEATDKRTTLVADWGEVAGARFVLHFDANGGTGAPEDRTKDVDLTAFVFVIPDGEPTYDGHTFMGWSKDSKATKATHHAGDTIRVTSEMTLFAVWAEGHVDTGSTGIDGMDWKTTVSIVMVCVLAVFIVVRLMGVI